MDEEIARRLEAQASRITKCLNALDLMNAQMKHFAAIISTLQAQAKRLEEARKAADGASAWEQLFGNGK